MTKTKKTSWVSNPFCFEFLTFEFWNLFETTRFRISCFEFLFSRYQYHLLFFHFYGGQYQAKDYEKENYCRCGYDGNQWGGIKVQNNHPGHDNLNTDNN